MRRIRDPERFPRKTDLYKITKIMNRHKLFNIYIFYV
jgi:hypothetical protein